MIRIASATIVSLSLLAACNDPPKTDETMSAAAPVAEAPAARAAVTTFEDVVANFDAAKQHLVWVLPPGVVAQGPFGAQVVVKADGVTELDTTIPLTAEKPAAGSRAEYPTGAEVLRLSTDSSYPQRLKDIQGVVEGIKARLGPGHGELSIASDFQTEIADAYREEYCVKQNIPPISIYLEQGEPAVLQQLPIGGGEAILRATLLASCQAPPP